MDQSLRTPLGRTLYDKLQHEQKHKQSNHEYWYTINTEYLTASLVNNFVQAFQDEDTCQFLLNCFDKSDWLMTQIYHTVMKLVLTWFMTSTSANGLLGRGSMFVLSSAQFQTLLQIPDNWKGKSLLDLGAGDGNVTQKMASFFDEVYVTELSATMRWRLRKRGYRVLDVDDWDTPDRTVSSGGYGYDVVSCLNLIDRCDQPLTLLRRIRTVLDPRFGKLILAVVFPVKQYVEATSDHQPVEVLDVSGSRVWEVQLESFVTNVLVPSGFQMFRWSRLPYLCEGDFTRSFYYLNQVVMVLKVHPGPSNDTQTVAASVNNNSVHVEL